MDPIGLAIGELRRRRPLAHRQREPARADRRVGRPARRQHVRRAVPALRDALLRHSDLFVATTTEKLLTYALGRGLEPYDGAAVRAIVRAAGRHEYRFSAIVLGSSPARRSGSGGPSDRPEDRAAAAHLSPRDGRRARVARCSNAMVPRDVRARQTAAAPVRRLGFVYIPMGSYLPSWKPAAEGKLDRTVADAGVVDPVHRSGDGRSRTSS